MILASTNNQPYLTVLFLMCFFSDPPPPRPKLPILYSCCCSTKATYSIQFAAVQLKLPMGVCLCVKLWECVCGSVSVCVLWRLHQYGKCVWNLWVYLSKVGYLIIFLPSNLLVFSFLLKSIELLLSLNLSMGLLVDCGPSLMCFCNWD